MTIEISAQALTKKFISGKSEIRAVDQVDLAVECGEFLLIYGRSGSGKSTLLNLLAGLIRPTSGSLRVGSCDVVKADTKTLEELRRNYVGMIFQDNNLIAEFTAIENVALAQVINGSSTKQALASTQNVLERIGIGELGNRLPAEMSGGQRQRVGIARALNGKKRILLADEPTGALDSKNSNELFSLLREMSISGTTVIVATHDPIALKYGTRKIWMENGRVVSEDPDV